jgi:hypothetical protein
LRCSKATPQVDNVRTGMIGLDGKAETANLSGGVLQSGVVIGVLFIGVFCAVGFAFACTELLMTRFDIRRRVMVGEGGVGLILAVNFCSLVLLWLIASILVAASGYRLYLQLSVIALGAQLIWLIQHLWSYYRDRVHVSYEN